MPGGAFRGRCVPPGGILADAKRQRRTPRARPGPSPPPRPGLRRPPPRESIADGRVGLAISPTGGGESLKPAHRLALFVLTEERAKPYGRAASLTFRATAPRPLLLRPRLFRRPLRR